MVEHEPLSIDELLSIPNAKLTTEQKKQLANLKRSEGILNAHIGKPTNIQDETVHEGTFNLRGKVLPKKDIDTQLANSVSRKPKRSRSSWF